MATLLCRAAAERPMLVVLDDLHWADESSLLLLSFVAAQLATNPVAMVGAYRSTEVGPDHPIAKLLHDVSRRGHVVSLGGLDTDGVAALMASTAGTQLREELAAAVHRQTGGNPLFVGEILRHLAERGVIGQGADGRTRIGHARQAVCIIVGVAARDRVG